MKMPTTIRLATASVLASLVLAAQPVVTPTPDRPDDIEKAGVYTISNSFEMGYRFSDVSGNRDVYRSSVNFGNGLRLFEGQLRINTQEGKGSLFDEFTFNTVGAGNDPYQSSILRVEKNVHYRYDMQFRIVNYFNRLPSLWNGEHGVDSERVFQNHDLTLFPGTRFEVLLGYDRYNHTRPGFSSEGVSNVGAFQKGQFIRLTNNLRRLNNQYRVGVNVRAAGLAITFVQAFDNYKEDTEYGDGSIFPTQATNVQPVESLRRDEPIHGNTPVTSIAIRTENEHLVGFQGRYVYASGSRNFVLSEDVTALDPARGLSTLRQTVILGEGRRKQGSGDFTLTVMPSDPWTITNTTSINNSRIAGDAALFEMSLFTTESIRLEELGVRHISNATEVNFRPVPKFGLYGAYRFSTRRIRTREFFQFPGSDFEVPPADQENDIHSGVGGFRWRPIRGLRISFDAEVGRADRPLTPISEREFHNETARVQWRKKAFVFGASFKSAVNDNSASLINHSYTSRQFGVNASWTQKDGSFTIDANYTKLDLNTASGIFNFLQATEPGVERHNFYTSNLHTLYFGSRIQARPRLTFYLGYSLAKDTGDGRSPSYSSGVVPNYPNFSFDGDFYNSFPLAYQSPLARLSVQVNRVLSWNFGWQFYTYSEEFIGQQNYHAHVGYSSFRWTF